MFWTTPGPTSSTQLPRLDQFGICLDPRQLFVRDCSGDVLLVWPETSKIRLGGGIVMGVTPKNGWFIMQNPIVRNG